MFRKKWLLRGVIGSAVVVVVVLVVLALNAGRIAKTAIEKFGPEILGVPVTVTSVMIFPISGKGAIFGLKIGNPGGFHEANLVSLGKVSVSIDLGSLAGKVVRIRDVEIVAPEVNWEGGFSDSNVGRLQENARRFAGAQRASDSKQSASTKVIIGRLQISGAEVGARLKGTGAAIRLTLPDIIMTDIGAAQGGANFAEVASLILGRVTGAIGTALRNSPELIGSVLKGAGNVGESVLGGVKSIFGK